MKKIKRLAVKVGTSTLTYDTGLLNLRRVELLARVLSGIKNQGIDVVLISSGAVGVGMGKLGLARRPAETRGKQAVAAVGQVELMNIYSKFFSDYGNTVAQVLLTKDAVVYDERRTNAVNTFRTLFQLGVVPIVNENDVISSYELEFGDNDTLSAHVATLVEADLLIILSDIDGLFDKDPKTHMSARLIGRISEITERTYQTAGGAGSSRGTGGMVTKLNAVELAWKQGIDVVIANGENPHILYEIVEGKPRGTYFECKEGATVCVRN